MGEKVRRETTSAFTEMLRNRQVTQEPKKLIPGCALEQGGMCRSTRLGVGTVQRCLTPGSNYGNWERECSFAGKPDEQGGCWGNPNNNHNGHKPSNNGHEG